MYLGSFEIGSGFVFIVWPWWGWPIFAALFFLRFNRQMKKEEASFSKQESQEYLEYCKKTPRMFPKLNKVFKVKARDIINLDEALSTKETRSLWAWLLGAFVLESFQQWVVLGQVDFRQTIIIFMASGIVFMIGFISYYRAGR